MTLPDALACAGEPSQTRQIGADDWLVSYTPNSLSTPSLTAGVPILGSLVDPSVSISNTKTCRMALRIQGGRVASVHYVAGSSWLSGPNAACTPLVRDCLDHPDHTPLPAGFEAARYLETKK